MKRPDEVYVLGMKLRVVHKNESPKNPEDGEECEGLYLPYPKQIQMWSKLQKDEYLKILLHEVGHIIDLELCLNLGERKISCISSAYADFLIRNKIIKL